MTMNDTHDAFAKGLELMDGARCTFMGCGMVAVRQQDETKACEVTAALPEDVLLAALEAEAGCDDAAFQKGLDIGNFRVRFMGQEVIMFIVLDEQTNTYTDVVITADDVRKVLAVLDGRTVH